LFNDGSATIIHNDSYIAEDFIKNSLFYYRQFYQIEINNEYTAKFDTGDSYYMYYVERGSMFITLNRKMFSLTQNDLLVVKKNVDVSISANSCKLYAIEFDGKLTNDFLTAIGSVNSPGISMIDFSGIIMFFIRIKELSLYDIRNEVYISFNIEAILVEIYTRIHYGNDKDNPRNYAILQAIFYIEQNIESKIRLEDLCEFVGYSVYHFSRLFKNEVGMSPYSYVIKYRLDLSKHLLITTNLPIRAISKKCGYANEINFYNIFKKNFNITPRKYRLQSENKET
jgi:AraC-like DNA-binding protein